MFTLSELNSMLPLLREVESCFRAREALDEQVDLRFKASLYSLTTRVIEEKAKLIEAGKAAIEEKKA